MLEDLNDLGVWRMRPQWASDNGKIVPLSSVPTWYEWIESDGIEDDGGYGTVMGLLNGLF